jgi:uncharacterized repeat protein (TIGR03806 family)
VWRSRRAERAPRALVLAVLILGLQAGCTPEVRTFAPDGYPERLSEWGILTRSGDRLRLGDGAIAYDINTPLFSDYALKLRVIWLPPGTAARFDPQDVFDLPVGTILAKSFFYYYDAPVSEQEQVPPLARELDWDGEVGRLDLAHVELIETRLLVRQAGGWDALPYVWDGDDARLAITGALRRYTLAGHDGPQDLAYVVPTRNECDNCHATDHSTGATQPIGIKARHLDRGYHAGPVNQLEAWAQRGRLDGLPAVRGRPNAQMTHADDDLADDLAHHARSYLDANCGHCHNPVGAADTSGLWLDYADHPPRQLGVCKQPIAAGRGSGGHFYSIVPGHPEQSILAFRMATTDPAARMPELGRDVVHREGLALVSEWIASLDGACR